MACGSSGPQTVGISGLLSIRCFGLAVDVTSTEPLWRLQNQVLPFSLALVFTGLSSWHRMDDSYCLSALRSPFYPIPTPGSLPPLHPSAMHLHLSGVRYPPELSHSSLAALHSERMSSLSAER